MAVIGAGTMGNGIAHSFAQSGYRVNLIDIDEIALNKAQKSGFMAFLVPESELLVQEYNRMLTNLNGLSEKIFLNRLKLKFNVVNCKSYDLCKKTTVF